MRGSLGVLRFSSILIPASVVRTIVNQACRCHVSIHTDCKGVWKKFQKLTNHPWQKRPIADDHNSELWEEVMQHVATIKSRGASVRLSWDHSHQDFDAVTQRGMDPIHWYGNKMADALAGDAVSIHEVSEFYAQRMNDSDKLFRYIIGRIMAIEITCETVSPPKQDKLVSKTSRS